MPSRTAAAPPPPPQAQAIGAVRAFNRDYTRHLGLLDQGLLGSEFTLTEARVLYELAQRETTATEIARQLGLDQGYLSRILARLERRRDLKRIRSATDGRASLLHLTAKGRGTFESLDRAAKNQVAAFLKPLSAAQRDELLGAMRSVQRILTPDGAPMATDAAEKAVGATTPATTAQRSDVAAADARYIIRDVQLADIRLIAHRQQLLYSKEYGWDRTYEVLAAQILADFVKSFDPSAERGWVAESDGRLAGSVFVVRSSDSEAKLRLLYVEPFARGLGIGRRLVQESVDFARSKGYRMLTLWTNDVLVSARRIYEAAGFRLTKQDRHHSFGKDLVGQTWELTL
ncbi:MAG TPA: bifunctional helix-turn-helix transcriptional regulator/GNAT family N-acetyltransferase [Steroidobacteraceae bacterium]|jgi:DNA-binding MarR family transcriptional regulator/GNAT superfamily N-acetyltransferase